MSLPTSSDQARPFRCPICKKRFTTKQIRNSHVLMHENAEKFECNQCDRVFSCGYKLILHREKAHTGENPFEKPFGCKICPNRFNSEYDLNTHHLELHSEKHLQERNVKCKICGKAFEKESKLKRHLVVHSDARPFGCEFCSKRFKQQCVLKAHYLDMHSEKKFECETCGKAFGRESRLKKHLFSHWAEKPFQCEDCSKIFARLDQLKEHRFRHETIPGKEFECSLQKFKYDRSDMSFAREFALHNSGSARIKCNLGVEGKTPSYRFGQDDVVSDGRSPENSEGDNERDLHGQTARDGRMATARSRNGVWNATPVTTLSSEPDGEWPTQSGSVANLKVVFDVEYRAPD